MLLNFFLTGWKKWFEKIPKKIWKIGPNWTGNWVAEVSTSQVVLSGSLYYHVDNSLHIVPSGTVKCSLIRAVITMQAWPWLVERVLSYCAEIMPVINDVGLQPFRHPWQYKLSLIKTIRNFRSTITLWWAGIDLTNYTY